MHQLTAADFQLVDLVRPGSSRRYSRIRSHKALIIPPLLLPTAVEIHFRLIDQQFRDLKVPPKCRFDIVVNADPRNKGKRIPIDDQQDVLQAQCIPQCTANVSDVEGSTGQEHPVNRALDCA